MNTETPDTTVPFIASPKERAFRRVVRAVQRLTDRDRLDVLRAAEALLAGTRPIRRRQRGVKLRDPGGER